MVETEGPFRPVCLRGLLVSTCGASRWCALPLDSARDLASQSCSGLGPGISGEAGNGAPCRSRTCDLLVRSCGGGRDTGCYRARGSCRFRPELRELGLATSATRTYRLLQGVGTEVGTTNRRVPASHRQCLGAATRAPALSRSSSGQGWRVALLWASRSHESRRRPASERGLVSGGRKIPT